MGGHPSLSRYMKERREAQAKENEESKKRVKQGLITDMPCKRCGNWLRTYTEYFHRCPRCALVYKIKEVSLP